MWGHPLWSDTALAWTRIFKERYGNSTQVIFFDLWCDATLVYKSTHWPAGIRLCSRESVSVILFKFLISNTAQSTAVRNNPVGVATKIHDDTEEFKEQTVVN